jgi:hypothetical protein
MAAGLPPALAAEAALLQEGIAQTARALAHLQAQPADGPRFARRVMDHMADVYCGALLAEEAARDLALGDARKAVIASGYLKKAFGPKGLALDTAPDPAQTHFAAMIGYGHVPPEAAGYAAPKSSPMRPPPGAGSIRPGWTTRCAISRCLWSCLRGAIIPPSSMPPPGSGCAIDGSHSNTPPFWTQAPLARSESWPWRAARD